MIYDMPAALKLAQNYEEKKEQRGWGGGGRVEKKKAKTMKTHKQNSIKSLVLCPAIGSGSYEWDKECT